MSGRGNGPSCALAQFPLGPAADRIFGRDERRFADRLLPHKVQISPRAAGRRGGYIVPISPERVR